MAVFTSAASWSDLFSQDTPASYGVLMSPKDTVASKLSVQVGLQNTGQSVWDSPAPTLGWDNATWDDDNFAIWTDITNYVRGLEWDRGCADPIQEAEVGTAKLTLDNRTGNCSPWATTGPFSNPTDGTPTWDIGLWDTGVPGSGTSVLRPGTPFRFGVTRGADSTWRPFFTGLIETITEDSQDGVDGWVQIGLVDIASTLAAIGAGTGGNAGGELTDGNVGVVMLIGILDDIGWQYDFGSDDSDILNTVPLQVPAVSANRLAAAQQVAASCFGQMVAGSDGFLYFVTFDKFTALVDVDEGDYTAFSNAPDIAAGETPIVNLTPYSSTDRLLNSVVGTRVGGAAQTATDPASIAQFGVQASALGWPRTDLLQQNDSDVLDLVTKVINASSNAYLGISSIDLDADQDPVNLYRRMGTIATLGLAPVSAGVGGGLLQFPVRWQHPSGAIWNVTLNLLGFHMNITMEGSQAKWTATLRTAASA